MLPQLSFTLQIFIYHILAVYEVAANFGRALFI